VLWPIAPPPLMFVLLKMRLPLGASELAWLKLRCCGLPIFPLDD